MKDSEFPKILRTDIGTHITSWMNEREESWFGSEDELRIR